MADVGLAVPSTIVVAFGFSDFNPSIRKFHLDRAKQTVDLGKVLGAPMLGRAR